jgi:hypothetical protein
MGWITVRREHLHMRASGEGKWTVANNSLMLNVAAHTLCSNIFHRGMSCTFSLTNHRREDEHMSKYFHYIFCILTHCPGIQQLHLHPELGLHMCCAAASNPRLHEPLHPRTPLTPCLDVQKPHRGCTRLWLQERQAAFLLLACLYSTSLTSQSNVKGFM